MRFTIRDVLWLTVVVALGVGWWVNTRRTAHEITVLRSDNVAKSADLGVRANALDIAFEKQKSLRHEVEALEAIVQHREHELGKLSAELRAARSSNAATPNSS